MELKKKKIGELISPIDERNDIGIKDFYGINIHKEFMPTVANTEGLDETKYKVVRRGRFVYSGMQTGRDGCIRVSMYRGEQPVLVSPAYTTFEVTSLEDVIPLYFFMIFLSTEMDRYGAFCSDGSIRSNLDWDVFCDIEISLPSIPIQQKYVDVYSSLIDNQKSYERGLDDLKLTCEAYVENLRRQYESVPIGPYIVESDQRNVMQLPLEKVRGLATSKEMIFTKADMNGVSLDNYKTFSPGQIAYVPDTSRRADKVSLACNDSDETYLVSSISNVFGTKKESLIPQYLMLFLTRSEFDRYARFNSWGSARETFNYEDMCEVRIPIPSISVQESISNIYQVLKERRAINERLKEQIKGICPILIKGSIDEAKKGA